MQDAPNVAVLEPDRLEIQVPADAGIIQQSRLLDRDVNAAGNMRYLAKHYFLHQGRLPPWNAGAHPIAIAADVWNGYLAPDPLQPHHFIRNYVGVP